MSRFEGLVLREKASLTDPEDTKRGLVAFCLKWPTNQDPDSRLARDIKRSESPELFLSLYGQIGIMNDASHSRSLDDLLLAVGEIS